MGTKKPNIKIENSKVIFSQEILNYFENLKNDENSEWINKYFKILSDSSNLIAKKSNVHHLGPVFSFKDKYHKNRKEAKNLADNFKENLIKLSRYNHILAHYYLWKIYGNWDSKHAVHQLCDIINIEDFTENEIKEIARIKENCIKENRTEEEMKIYRKQYHKLHKKELNEYSKNYNKINNEELTKKKRDYYYKYHDKHLEQKRIYNRTYSKEISERGKLRRQNNPEKFKKQQHKFYEKNKDKLLNQEKLRRSALCYDPKENNICTLSALYNRKYKNKELYKDVIPSECILLFTPYTKQIPLILIKPLPMLMKHKNDNNDNIEQKIKNKNKRLKHARDYRKNNRETIIKREKNFRSQLCYDPIKKDFCKLTALKGRKRYHFDLYEKINPIEWVLKFTPIIQEKSLILTKSLPMISDMINKKIDKLI